MYEATEKFQKLLDTEIERNIRSRDKTRKLTWFLKGTLFSLSAIATVLLGWDFSEVSLLWIDETLAKNLALLVTALATVVSSFIGLWRTDDYWARQKVIVASLRKIERNFQYLITLKTNRQMKVSVN
jgi:hypothetical protein